MLKNATYIGHWRYGKRSRNGGKWIRNPDDLTIFVKVPAIVDLETWEAAQAQFAENKQNARRNLTHQYLMSKRVTCGNDGLKMSGNTSSPGYSYYRCGASTKHHDYAQTCNLPQFRADDVDATVWEWVKGLLTDPEAFARGLRKYQQERHKENQPIRARISVVNDLITDNRQQLERLLDLYLAGDFPKEMLTDRKIRLEKTILALEKERAGLAAHLEAGGLTENQIKTLKDFIARVADGIDIAEADFETRRGVIEALNVQATLAVEDGRKVAHVACIVGERVCELRRITPTGPQVKMAL